MAKRMISAAQYVKRWADSSRNNVQRYVDGIDAVDDNPMEAAANAQDRYASGVQRAVSENKFADGCRGVSKEEWKNMAKTKGKANMSAGITAAEPKMSKVAGPLLAHCAQVSAEVQTLPKGTLEDSIARSRKAIEGMARFRKPR